MSNADISKPKFGFGGSTCPRCEKIVYFTEQAQALGGVYHKSCLTCKTCNKKLDSTNLCDNKNELYCKTCHTKLFGPKGNRAGATLEGEESIKKVAAGSTNNINTSNENVSSSSNNTTAAGNSGSQGNLLKRFGGSDICPTCQKKVYFAEQIIGPGSVKYHKLCFKCSVCRKQLDSTSVCEDKDHIVYCQTDYTKLFGPKGNRIGSTL